MHAPNRCPEQYSPGLVPQPTSRAQCNEDNSRIGTNVYCGGHPKRAGSCESLASAKMKDQCFDERFDRSRPLQSLIHSLWVALPARFAQNFGEGYVDRNGEVVQSD